MAEETDPPEEKSLELQDLEEVEAPAAEGDGKDEGDVDGDEPQTLGEAGGLPDIGDLPRSAKDLEAVYDIPVKVSAILGKTTMQVSQLLKLGRGAVIELDRKVGEAIDIYVNNRLVARGEVVVVEDRLGVTMTEIIKTESSN
ncbi:MAG: flagellar motor switch protein FliN [Proteobacteria bacterium]|nr:flagellar motor switch protein FliN [Pseudomonadota bacterium]